MAFDIRGFVEQRPHVFGFIAAFVSDRRIGQLPAGAQILQRALGDVEQTADLGVVESAALGGRIETPVELVHLVGQSMNLGLQVRPCALFD